MSKKNVTVGPNGSGGWKVSEGTKTVSNHRTQEAAIAKGKPIAVQNQSELSIQGRNGQIREKNSYGPDPESSKG
ncbi:DUF2188 domain-containing protein [soil metagenome]